MNRYHVTAAPAVYRYPTGNRREISKPLAGLARLADALSAVALVGHVFGCSNSNTASAPPCSAPPTIPPPLEPTEQGFAHNLDDHFVLGDARIPDEVFSFYLDRTPEAVAAVLDLFHMTSPWEKQLIVRLTETTGTDCIDGAMACARTREIVFASNEDILQHNLDGYHQAQSSEERAASAWLFFNSPRVFYHEIVHALRFGFTWWGVEEGLAEYGGSHLVAGKAATATNRLLASETLSLTSSDDRLLLGHASAYMTQLSFRDTGRWEGANRVYQVTAHVKAPYVSLSEQYQVGDIVTKEVHGKYNPFLDITIGMARTGNDDLAIDIYTNFPTAATEEITCTNSGIQYVTRTRMGSEVSAAKRFAPYATLASGQYDRPENGGGSFYPTAMCFFERMRTDYGENAVNALVVSLSEFAWNHETDPAPFPFFETVRKVTGMDSHAAAVYFNFFSFPIDDAWYMVGDLCHQ